MTPLLLAYALGEHRAALMLLAAGAYPKARTPAPQRWEAQHVAALSKNPHLTRTAVLAMLQETDRSWQRRVPTVAANLAALPDFTVEMTVELSCWIPLVSVLLPRDTMTIRKRGGSLRLEFTLLGMEGFTWTRGDIAFLVLADDKEQPGVMYVMDNEFKTAGVVRDAFTDPQDYQVQDWVRKLLTRESKSSDWWSRSVEFEREFVRGWFGGVTEEPLTEDVGSWPGATVWAMRQVRLMEWAHKPLLSDLPLDAWWSEQYTQEWRRRHAKGLHGHHAFRADAPDTPLDPSSVPATPSSEMIAQAAAATYGSETPESGLATLHAALRALADGTLSGDSAALPASGDHGGDHGGEHGEHGEHGGEHGEHGEHGGEHGGEHHHHHHHHGRRGHIGAEGLRNVGLPSSKEMTFEEYFKDGVEGWVDPTDEEERNRGSHAVAIAGAPAAAKGALDEDTAAKFAAAADIVSDETPRRVAQFVGANVKEDTKTMDFKVCFTKDFPLTVEQILPVIECVARTGRHFANFKRFFESKMPKDQGFPVQFSIPVFPFVNAVVTFGACTLESPPEELFRLPPDYALGKYVERGFIRQL
jgi:GPCR-chaperone